ncbi:MAG: hypothetical protein D5R99_01830 [Methanocalculus sp. MSAO_Arc1]|uniref:hypothetical protein n=1 Tax=Methanocalculus TaxID=71151 RepID=UPI000FEF2B06|nr:MULTISPECIES: hypothetical protein [unclassified Methanocalculus]MCP1662325.1 CRISPR/Cas system-associated exonuclease Cas4 (RecB family) [Methanocalculus sp. AMF5]RQD81508.1 MAG: hypothetical protein D5R99_01830 [Methanocalculus sp. MSAO_Arc1]
MSLPGKTPEPDTRGDPLTRFDQDATQEAGSGSKPYTRSDHNTRHATPGAADPRYIPVSTLVRVSVCPVRVYLERNEAVAEPFEYTISKQIGYHLDGCSQFCDDPEGFSDFGLENEAIWEEIRLVRPDIPAMMRVYLDECITAWEGGDASLDVPVAVDIAVANKKYGISGRIDWVFDRDPVIGILRATRAPTYGVWRQDRIRAAAYLLAAEEMQEIQALASPAEPVSAGFLKPQPRQSGVRIVYIPSGVVRTVTPTATDRRVLLDALKKAAAIYRGETPRKPPDAPCERCPKHENCIARTRRDPPSLFDRFFKKT